jgi:hypothetical protein
MVQGAGWRSRWRDALAGLRDAPGAGGARRGWAAEWRWWVGRGGRFRSARREQWASALWQASMPKGAEQKERRAVCQRCACCGQEGLPRARAESEGRWRQKQRKRIGVLAKAKGEQIRRAWAARSCKEHFQRWWKLAEARGNGERQRRAIDAVLRDDSAIICAKL